jgi:hypothetical protein
MPAALVSILPWLALLVAIVVVLKARGSSDVGSPAGLYAGAALSAALSVTLFIFEPQLLAIFK